MLLLVTVSYISAYGASVTRSMVMERSHAPSSPSELIAIREEARTTCQSTGMLVHANSTVQVASICPLPDTDTLVSINGAFYYQALYAFDSNGDRGIGNAKIWYDAPTTTTADIRSFEEVIRNATGYAVTIHTLLPLSSLD